MGVDGVSICAVVGSGGEKPKRKRIRKLWKKYEPAPCRPCGGSGWAKARGDYCVCVEGSRLARGSKPLGPLPSLSSALTSSAFSLECLSRVTCQKTTSN